MECTVRFRAVFVCTLVFALSYPALHAGKAVVPGRLSTPYPTITNLAVEWLLEGDDNLNATCEVRYRMKDEAAWRPAMPLRRIPAGNSTRTQPIYYWDSKLSGSILDLKPGTSYEIGLELRDPD